MTVMRVGKINDFLSENGNYIKGKLIRLNIEDDYHMVAIINDELNKGVYL